MHIEELVRSGGELNTSLVPRIMTRSVPARRGNHDLVVDEQETAVLAGSEELVRPGVVDAERPLVLAEKWFGIRPERVIAMEDAQYIRAANGSAA